jgi:hypothetical protein
MSVSGGYLLGSPLATLPRDLKKAARTLGEDEARFLVDMYYGIQDFRIHSNNQVSAILRAAKEVEGEDEPVIEPHETLGFFYSQFRELEHQIHASLDAYSMADPMGEWVRGHHGVGPVIAAGLISNIDITKSPHVSSLWRFAGLAPGQKLVKGQPRDWNARLKVLMWRLGDSFIKHKGAEACYYGHLYDSQKTTLIRRNEAGEFAETAKQILAEKQFRRDTKAKTAYEEGKLPDAHITARARRYAVKRFLSHYWVAAYRLHYGVEPPEGLWIVEYGGHPATAIIPSPIPYPPLPA